MVRETGIEPTRHLPVKFKFTMFTSFITLAVGGCFLNRTEFFGASNQRHNHIGLTTKIMEVRGNAPLLSTCKADVLLLSPNPHMAVPFGNAPNSQHRQCCILLLNHRTSGAETLNRTKINGLQIRCSAIKLSQQNKRPVSRPNSYLFLNRTDRDKRIMKRITDNS